MVLTFWGTRGSIACPTPRHMVYGGNTSCLEISAGRHTVICDAGTGIRQLGADLLKRDTRNATMLFTHTHWDHINGFPFFAPAYAPKRHFRVIAGHLRDVPGGVRGALSGQMAQPMFPVPLETMRAHLDFEDARAGDDFALERGVRIRTAPLNHPNGATGYRIEHGGKSLAYITDTEHVIGKPDQNVLDLIEGCDLVVYDCTYTDDEFPAKVGWGHSTWQEGVRLCKMAKAKRLAIFHHEPDHDDAFMHKIAKKAKKMWPKAFVAREGSSVKV